MAEEVFVARPSDVDALGASWTSAKEGAPQFIRLQAPFGGGRRALVGQFLANVTAENEDSIGWRVVCLDHENGVNWLVRMYGSLIAGLTSDVLRRGKVEMILNAQLPSQPKRVQGWFQQFIESMKESKPDAEKGAIQLKLPKDNPLIGLVEVVIAIAKKFPIVLDLQNPNVVHSIALAQFIEALHAEASAANAKLMVILHDEEPDDVNKALFPMPLLDTYSRLGDALSTQVIAPWGAEETAQYLNSKGLESDAARLAEIAGGRPGFIAELVEILEESGKLQGPLDDVSLASLVPLNIDEDELNIPEPTEPVEGEEPKRKHAGPDDVGQIAYFAALLGQAFPSGLVADMGGYDRDSVDDIVDAMEDLFEEVQFSEELGTWIYKFKRGSWRTGVLEKNDTDEGHEMARRVGLFMERFLVPRGYGFIVKTARVFAENGAGARANHMRSVALSSDAGDIWGLGYDFFNYFDDIAWPAPLLRTIYMNLLEKLIPGGQLASLEKVHTSAVQWATDNDDKNMVAWLLFAGSRIDLRRQDIYRARDRARDAITLYTTLEQPLRVAEIHNHLAGIELQDGNLNAAIEHINNALKNGQVKGQDDKVGVIPGVAAQAEHLRGLIARRSNKLEEAANHFRQANDIAGQANLGPLALDSGLAFGEALLAGRQIEQARDVLRRVVQIAQSLQNPMRERSACELLAQAEGATKNYEAALQLAGRTLQLSQALKFEQVLPIDLYNVGFFNYALNKPTEALTFFRQAEQRVGSIANHPVVKELYYFKGMAHLKTGELDDARKSFSNGIKPAQQHKDWGKAISAMEELANIERQSNHPEVAKKWLTDALNLAQQANLKEQRKSLRKKLDQLA